MYRSFKFKTHYCSDFNSYLNAVFKSCDSPYIIFSIYVIANIIVMWSVEVWSGHTTATQYLGRYLLCIALAILLLAKKWWPHHLQNYFALYFYGCVFYILPFANFLYVLHSHEYRDSVSNLMLVIFILLLITDWSLFLILLLLAFSAAFAINSIPHIAISFSICTCYQSFNTMLWTVFTAMFFSRYLSRNRRQRKLHEQNCAVQSGGFIAHELRTPLCTIGMYMKSVKRLLPELIQGYDCAKQLYSEKYHLDNKQLSILKGAVDDIEAETKAANNIIDMLLVKMNQQTQLKNRNFSRHEIRDIIENTLLRYPFTLSEKTIVKLKNSENFQIHANPNLVTHVLFNLLRNALYHIKAHGKGDVTISYQCGKQYNTLHFKDTGPGIHKRALVKVFSRNYSVSEQGIGLGLHFCQTVMQGLNGKIKCNSVFGEYTEFVLYFPHCKDKES